MTHGAALSSPLRPPPMTHGATPSEQLGGGWLSLCYSIILTPKNTVSSTGTINVVSRRVSHVISRRRYVRRMTWLSPDDVMLSPGDNISTTTLMLHPY